MPTWFMTRERFNFVGGFEEAKTSATIPEDLIFFLKVKKKYFQQCA